MKNILFYALCVLLAFASCQREETYRHDANKGFNVNIIVDELETGIKTRGVAPEEGEGDINSLYLAFFEKDNNGNGAFIGHYKVNTENLKMNATIAVPAALDNGEGVTNAKDYVILAFANLEETSSGSEGILWGNNDGYIDNITDFLAEFSSHTENSALQKMRAEVTGAGTDEEDNSHAIASNNLFMSARVVKAAHQTTTTIKLKRGVSRFDVRNEATTHTLTSVSVWGAATEATVWKGAPMQYKRMQRFYGVEGITGEEVKGKLYAFENVVAEPEANDKETTCLIIGLKTNPNQDKVRYYRVNIHQTDIAQKLKRNSSYQIIINSVTGEGSSTEYEAWTQNRNQLLISVNNWNLDDNGMILTDGTNALGLTVKRVNLDPAGDVREYSLYTAGTGVLEITRFDLPFEEDGITPGFTTVMEGNMLKVTATRLPTGKDMRRGSIEVSFAGLRGNITIVQQPMNEKMLRLDRTKIDKFAPEGPSGMAEGPIVVTASEPWIAEIFNVDAVSVNPGFSFKPDGEVATKLDSKTNLMGESFQVYTTGDNPDGNSERSGFIIVSLVEDPDNYSIAIPLVQKVVSGLQVLPAVFDVRFFADETPVNTDMAIGNLYEFTVTSGGASWSVGLSGGDTGAFVVDKITDTKFTVKVKEKNLTAAALTSTIKITGDDDNTINLPVIQQAAVISASPSGGVAANGGTVTVNVNSSNLPWDAEIIENWESGSSACPHEAWIEASTNGAKGVKLTNQAANGTFKVGFDELYFPLANLTPKIKIKVSISGVPGISQTIEVVQLPFKPTELKVMDVRHYYYGSLGGSVSYFTGYNNFLRASTLFGPGGTVNLPTVSVTEVDRNASPGTISSQYRYLHAGGSPNDYDADRYTSVENWRLANDGVVVYTSSVKGKQFTDPNSTLTLLGYTPAGRLYTAPARINTALLTGGDVLAKNIMNYLLNDGPFGVVNNPGSLSFTMDATCVSLENYSTGIPVIINGEGKAILVIDPKNRLVFIGEEQVFDTGYNIKITGDKDRFLGNLLSYVLNAAINGSAFTEIFSDNDRYNGVFKK